MTVASKILHQSDEITPAMYSAFDQYNKSFITTAPTCFGPTGHVPSPGSGTFVLLAAADRDMVVEDVLFSCDTDLMSNSTLLALRVHDRWELGHPGGSDSYSMRGFFHRVIDKQTVIRMSDHKTNTKTGSLPLLIPKGYFLIGRMRNSEGMGIIVIPYMQPIFSITRDKLYFFPTPPRGQCFTTELVKA